MATEKTIMLTGRQYTEIKTALTSAPNYSYNIGTDNHPEMVNITDIYLDTDPEFTRNSGQYALINDDKHVQVKIAFEE